MNTANRCIFFFSLVLLFERKQKELVSKTWAWPAWVSNNAGFQRGSFLNVMAGWWETQLQGAPGWLALRGDVIAGCTRLIDWPCCWVARDDGREARSCIAATTSCSPPLLPLYLFKKIFFTLPCFILFSFYFSSISLFSFFSHFFFFVYFCSLPSHSVILSFFSSLFVAGFSRLVVVCWGCCTTFCQRMLLSVF